MLGPAIRSTTALSAAQEDSQKDEKQGTKQAVERLLVCRTRAGTTEVASLRLGWDRPRQATQIFCTSVQIPL